MCSGFVHKMSTYIIHALRSSKVLTMLFMYFGTVCYVTASYFHLSLKQWSFMKALAIAVPVVLIEYQFSLRANKVANETHLMNAVQVLLVTLCFYFINVWILNWLVLKNKIIVWRELVCFGLIAAAFFISTNM